MCDKGQEMSRDVKSRVCCEVVPTIRQKVNELGAYIYVVRRYRIQRKPWGLYQLSECECVPLCLCLGMRQRIKNNIKWPLWGWDVRIWASSSKRLVHDWSWLPKFGNLPDQWVSQTLSSFIPLSVGHLRAEQVINFRGHEVSSDLWLWSLWGHHVMWMSTSLFAIYLQWSTYCMFCFVNQWKCHGTHACFHLFLKPFKLLVGSSKRISPPSRKHWKLRSKLLHRSRSPCCQTAKLAACDTLNESRWVRTGRSEKLLSAGLATSIPQPLTTLSIQGKQMWFSILLNILCFWFQFVLEAGWRCLCWICLFAAGRPKTLHYCLCLKKYEKI